MKRVQKKLPGRDVSQLLSMAGVPNDKMSFIFRTPFGDVVIKYGYITTNESKANAYLIQTLRKTGVKIDMEAMEKQQKGFINSVKSFLKKK